VSNHFDGAPIVSVIVPAFNAEDTLAETLRSAAESTCENIEIIVVDDGSTDGTGEIAAAFAAADERFRVYRQVNGGLSAALNAGFSQARGQFVARLDSDDLWHPSKLTKQVDLAVACPELAFIFTFARYIDQQSCVIRDGPAQRFPRRSLCRGIYESIVAGGSSALMKRSSVEKIGALDETFKTYEDLLLQLALGAAHPVGFVPEYLVGYRVRTGSLSDDIDNMLRSWRAVRNRLKSEFPRVPQPVYAWAHGSRCAMFAEGYAWRGRYSRAATLLAEALWYDPIWTLEFLRYRLARRAIRGFSKPEPLLKKLHFLDYDPARPVIVGPIEQTPNGRFARFKESRSQILAELDNTLANDQPDSDKTPL
jgi:glycosyltransferase involved in cell wall biosynthesis